MSQPPHPTPGASGEGPPIAPPKWRWRCGNRLRDMYFYSPQGKTYRSKKELAAYLGTLADGPSPDDYCWNVTAEIVKTGVWNKDAVIPKTPKTPKTPNTPKTPKSKSKKADTEAPAKKSKRSDTGTNASPQMASPSTPAAHNGVQFSQVEPLAIRAPGPVLSKKVTTTGSLTSRAKVKAKKNETKAETRAETRAEARAEARAETRAETKADMKDEKKTETKAEMEPPLPSPGSAPPEPRTFKEILAEPSSFKWLYHPDTIGKFLEEAKKLNELEPAEISEMRKLLVDRNPQMGNMSKYPNQVLKIFLRLLGTDGLSAEPSDTLGKVELADLCVKLAKT